MSRILIKAIKPHRQKILVDGKEMKLQQWANRKAAGALRDMGGDVQGEQFTNSRDNLMRDAVMNPENYGIKFVDREAVPFEGQELSPELSEPDIEGEKAEIDAQFAPDEDEGEVPSPNIDPMSHPDWHEDMSEEESFALAEKLDPNIEDDEEGFGNSPEEQKVFDHLMSLKPEEQEVLRNNRTPNNIEDDDEDPEEEHMKRIMTSHNTAFRDAWSILKSW